MVENPSFTRYLYGVALLFLLAIAGFRGACTAPEAAEKALQINGFRDIKIIDRAILLVGVRGCDETDASRYTATAVNSQGRRVTLYVCMGWPFKGSTVRTR